MRNLGLRNLGLIVCSLSGLGAVVIAACSANIAPENGVQGCGPAPEMCASGFYCAGDNKCWKDGTGPEGGNDAAPTIDTRPYTSDTLVVPNTDVLPATDAPPTIDALPTVDVAVLPNDKCTGPDATKLGKSCMVGVGACAATGEWKCVAPGPTVMCSAAAGAMATEVCNGLDDNCNGETDDDLEAPACDLAVGVCTGKKKACGGTAGWKACVASAYGNNYQATENLCDALDNDCDGQTDEAQGNVGTTCNVGVGECKKTGMYMCNNAKDASVCSVVAGPMATESCNGKDDDCNSVTDNGFACPKGTPDQNCTACGYSGTRTCAADCSWYACSRFAFADVVYDDVWSPLTHDTTCGAFNCQGDLCLLGATAPCYVISGGPGKEVPAGKYEVAWHVADVGTFDFEITAGGLTVALANDVDLAALTSAFVVQPFKVDACAVINFKLRAHMGARIRLYSATLRRVGEL